MHLIAQDVTATSVILRPHKIQNGEILVPANPDPPGKNGRLNGNRENVTHIFVRRVIFEFLNWIAVIRERITAEMTLKEQACRHLLSYIKTLRRRA